MVVSVDRPQQNDVLVSVDRFEENVVGIIRHAITDNGEGS